ncbi:MAG: ATP-binding protein [Byssovorax sp.]
MDRLFFRVYLHVLAGVLAAAVVARLLVMPHVEERFGRNIEETFSVPAALMAQMFADRHAAYHDFGGPAEKAAARFRFPVAIVPRAGLPVDAGTLARLDAGAVVRVGPARESLLFARIEGTDALLRMGPLPLDLPVGGRRGVALFLLFVAGLSLGVHALLRPLRRQLADLCRTADALGRGELDARAAVGSRDAIGTLASTLNRMAQEIQCLIAAREELLHMTSHELRTPIQRMHFGLEDARSAHDLPERERSFERMTRDLEELDQLIEELLSYVRLGEPRAPGAAPVELGSVLEDLCETMREMAGGIALCGPSPEEAPLVVLGDVRLIRRAVSNLVVNALRHARSRVEVRVKQEGPAVFVLVDDDGPGIPLPERERVFEPFYRLDEAETGEHRGFGLGLAIVRRIADMHGGHAAALGSELGGARFRLALPLRCRGVLDAIGDTARP